MSLQQEKQKNAYWRMFVQWLEGKSYAERVQLIQQCVQEVGPAPDDLRPILEKLLLP